MAFNFMLPLRIVQWVFADIVLGLSAHVASWWNNTPVYNSPSQINFLIFTSVWTAVIALPYLTLAPRFFPAAAHKFGILAAEVLTMLFWFAGFIAAAVYVSNLLYCHGGVCRAAQAAVVFAAFEWILFMVTTIMASIHVFTTRNSGSSKPAPAMEVTA